jgi:hypothetical protein
MADIPAITCTSCKKKFKTKTDVRGKRIKCPFCAVSFDVPMVIDDDMSTAIKAKGGSGADAATQPVPAMAADEAPENPYGVTEIDLAPRCPNCAHEMPSAEAVVCLNCGYNTLTREWGKTEKLIGISFGRHMAYLMPGIFAMFSILFCMLGLLFYDVYWPNAVEQTWLQWLAWTDHESLRMWSASMGMLFMFAMGRYCYIRFIVKPLPEEAKMD